MDGLLGLKLMEMMDPEKKKNREAIVPEIIVDKDKKEPPKLS